MTEKSLKEKIRPLYSELQGYLSQAPKSTKPMDAIFDQSLWGQYNLTVHELNQLLKTNFSKFFIEHRGGDTPHITIDTYRQKLGGIISRIHGEYFFDEPPPFSGMQSQSVQMLLDMQSKIDETLHNVDINSEERIFLEKFKSGLAAVSSVTDLLKLCLKLAEECGVGIASLIKFFG